MTREEINQLEKSVFNTLYDIDTRERAVEKDTGKTKLSYLPWATVYSEVCKNFSDVKYKFLRREVDVEEAYTQTLPDGTAVTRTVTYKEEVPYFETPSGIEVRTEVTINGETKEMCLPVYDTSYKAMSFEPYSYQTKYGEKVVPAARLDDIYKSIMRCFAKNLSMWGVGLNLWTKEDAPESVLRVQKLQNECMDLLKRRASLSEKTGKKVEEICKEMLPDENGNPKLCEDEDTLELLKKKLAGIRKIV